MELDEARELKALTDGIVHNLKVIDESGQPQPQSVPCRKSEHNVKPTHAD